MSYIEEKPIPYVFPVLESGQEKIVHIFGGVDVCTVVPVRYFHQSLMNFSVSELLSIIEAEPM